MALPPQYRKATAQSSAPQQGFFDKALQFGADWKKFGADWKKKKKKFRQQAIKKVFGGLGFSGSNLDNITSLLD